MTLACCNDADERKCKEQLKAFALKQKPIPAHIASAGMFPDTKTVFVSPIMTSGMYRLQAELYDCLKEYDKTGWDWYAPDRWVPHCTLALTGEDDESAFFRASDLILREFEKLSGEFVAIGLVRIKFSVEEICTLELGK